jgi:hypothetical protein
MLIVVIDILSVESSARTVKIYSRPCAARAVPFSAFDVGTTKEIVRISCQFLRMLRKQEETLPLLLARALVDSSAHLGVRRPPGVIRGKSDNRTM